MKDPNNTRDTAPRVGSPLWIYLTCVSTFGLAVFALAFFGLIGSEVSALFRNPVFWILPGFILVGEFRRIITPGSTETTAGQISTTFVFACLLYVGLPAAVLLHAVAAVVDGVFARRALHRNAFNAAQYTLNLAASSLVLAAFGISPSPARPWVPEGTDLPAIALAGVVWILGNHTLVNVAVALHERSSLGKALRRGLGYQVLVNFALLGLAPLVVIAMDRSAAFVPLIAIPFIAVYLNASGSVRREHQALHDGLTGLPNRKMLTERSENAIAEAVHRAERGGQDERVGLFLLDLDRFKEVNDTLGHAVGDRLLRLVAERLTHSVRPGDLVARLGGDEFAVLLPSVRDAQAAREVAIRLRAALNEPVRLDGTSFEIEGSVGIALHPDHAPDYEQLLQRADVAMYVAKESRSGVEIYSPAKDRNSPARLSMLGDLRRAVDHEELVLLFQPKVDLVDGEPVGMEALLRWRHPEKGLIGPERFLPIAEQTYLMRAITHRVVQGALAQAAAWWRAGLSVQVSVNVSGRDLLDTVLTDAIAAGLQERGLPAALLQLEITERILMNEPARAGDTLNMLADLGIPLSLDDFGTGYASLVRLKRSPVEEIKIDASFIRRLAESPDDAVIVRSIVDLARNLGLRSVAEGVEDARTAQRLREMRCDAAQGWHFGQPMDAAAATAWLARCEERFSEVNAHRMATRWINESVGTGDAP
ncbi:MAG: putative bifunctional diguanylate cyclase/phosphodiesterase [Actinomadura sp.]